MNSGVIYIATGLKYVNEAIQSATSLKTKMPKLPVTIFTDQEVEAKCFDQVELITQSELDSRIYKISYMYKSPYERTLFIDTDTYVCADFSEVFTLLDKFDVALTHGLSKKDHESPIYGIPKSFPEMNSGVFLFKKGPKVEKLFDDWLSLYKNCLEKSEKPINRDQFSLRPVLYKSDLRIATLTPEYNCLFHNIPFVFGEVKILHGRAPDLPEIASKINAKKDVHRVIRRPIGTNKTDIFYRFTTQQRILWSLRYPSRMFKYLRNKLLSN